MNCLSKRMPQVQLHIKMIMLQHNNVFSFLFFLFFFLFFIKKPIVKMGERLKALEQLKRNNLSSSKQQTKWPIKIK